MMGHMDHLTDENAKTYTVTVYLPDGREVHNGCTEIDANDRQLVFTDKNQKSHEFYGIEYAIVQE